ncbi:hypothetical protein GQ54DRAFT_192275 [Martensiomyces pterosporus]|nr:hypothetical protein GQ54DRAFT_192275 [Martensiomyces pterosporus]
MRQSTERCSSSFDRCGSTRTFFALFYSRASRIYLATKRFPLLLLLLLADAAHAAQVCVVVCCGPNWPRVESLVPEIAGRAADLPPVPAYPCLPSFGLCLPFMLAYIFALMLHEFRCHWLWPAKQTHAPPGSLQSTHVERDTGPLQDRDGDDRCLV